MKTFEVSYWTEGPGRSHSERVLVLAKNEKAAIKLTIKKQGVYKADQPYVTAKPFDVGDGLIIKYLEET